MQVNSIVTDVIVEIILSTSLLSMVWFTVPNGFTYGLINIICWKEDQKVVS
jgi:hypothetical protein